MVQYRFKARTSCKINSILPHFIIITICFACYALISFDLEVVSFTPLYICMIFTRGVYFPRSHSLNFPQNFMYMCRSYMFSLLGSPLLLFFLSFHSLFRYAHESMLFAVFCSVSFFSHWKLSKFLIVIESVVPFTHAWNKMRK